MAVAHDGMAIGTTWCDDSSTKLYFSIGLPNAKVINQQL